MEVFIFISALLLLSNLSGATAEINSTDPETNATLTEIFLNHTIAESGSSNLSIDLQTNKTIEIKFGYTPHFRKWLESRGYETYNFPRDDRGGDASFGGKVDDSDVPVNEPVIFVHGNGDSAGAFVNSFKYFLANGYKTSEIYATTYDFSNYHTKSVLTRIRRFIEAVIEYTGAEKVDIISFSMGVTTARKAIKGGKSNDFGEYNLGPPLSSKIDTFVGIAGLNYGTIPCLATPLLPLCHNTNGFYPGIYAFGAFRGRSQFLDDINSKKGYEGDFIYSIYSKNDWFQKYQLNGIYTGSIPNQTGQKVYNDLDHGQSRDLTYEVQYNMVKNHKII